MESQRQEQFNFLGLKKHAIKEKRAFVSQVGFYWVEKRGSSTHRGMKVHGSFEGQQTAKGG